MVGRLLQFPISFVNETVKEYKKAQYNIKQKEKAKEMLQKE